MGRCNTISIDNWWAQSARWQITGRILRNAAVIGQRDSVLAVGVSRSNCCTGRNRYAIQLDDCERTAEQRLLGTIGKVIRSQTENLILLIVFRVGSLDCHVLLDRFAQWHFRNGRHFQSVNKNNKLNYNCWWWYNWHLTLTVGRWKVEHFLPPVENDGDGLRR